MITKNNLYKISPWRN